MGYRPPKGIAPPWLEGKRTGRPKGSRSYAAFWRDAIWAYENRYEERVQPPTLGALIWWRFALMFPCELEEFLQAHDRV